MKKSATTNSPQTNHSTVSERKASANRANATRSTGPRTAAGKARSSLNALRHGILAKAAFNLKIEGEERRAEFDQIVAGLAQEYQPRTMTELMTVQQLAGCYWRLAKVWRYEQEAAWRMWVAPGIPMDEYNEFHEDQQYDAFTIRAGIIDEAGKFLPKAGLDRPTIPNGASARTILRYQGAINTMMTRCLTILERRRKERMASDEKFEEVDYINEPTAETVRSERASETEPAAEKSAQATNEAELPKRTQKAPTNAAGSSEAKVKVENSGAAASVIAAKSSSGQP
jgi:hypothetical protein